MATSNAGRERILARIRKARGHEASAAGAAEAIFPLIPDPMQRFLAECEANLTRVHRAVSNVQSAAILSQIVSELPAGAIYVEDDPVLRRLCVSIEERKILLSSEGRAPEDCVATLTLCDGLVAQTGSILTSSRHGGRGGSIVAPTHIVYATTDQLLPDVTSALRLAARDTERASYIGLISGSSRTADIEKILVQGAHGPVRVDIILEQR
ncbi:conserved hypothetical protein [Candidatus Koribacter versatilis Ellin345]|uniref:LUD domain-containing protein n=1 Tax=Koribacter versatilis (strain Ellin345) TaxID=204669 RepID=Q1IN29_KORVE|nr:LUD domain-containing protein [Candidatus Koribacter versatilis]ABF41721.1 conserved hypothetical protein [Candidatus Koribacter versatilis Ellin345]